MWLSEKTAAHGGGDGVRAQVGGVTIGGKNAAVLLDGECRNLGVVCPQGFAWRPGTGTQVLVLETGDGEKYILGAVDGGGGFDSLAAGEVCLRAGSGWLKLGADGSISAEGEVHLNGNVFITGRLFLNGNEVKAGS